MRRCTTKPPPGAIGPSSSPGIRTTIPFYRRILHHAGFAAGHYDTGFVEDFMAGTPD